MATIADLATDVQALTAAVAALPASGSTTTLTADDQASLDSSAAAVQAATASLTALTTPAPAA